MTIVEALKMLREKAEAQHDKVSLIYLDTIEGNWKRLGRLMNGNVLDMDLEDINQINVTLGLALSNLVKVTQALGVPFYQLTK